MLIRRGQWPILVVNAVYLAVAGAFYGLRGNHEFLLYIGVIVLFFGLILATNRRVQYPNGVLWGLTVWGVLHMCGGGVPVGRGVLYGQILIPLSKTYPVIRFDQVVHVIGFGVATLMMDHLLRPLLRPDLGRWTALSIVVAMAGLGVGALNEIVEFAAVVLVPETGVGGYVNTSLDLVADLAGAVLAVAYLRIRGWRAPRTAPESADG
ncbi:MAG: DUF2238 domain-containing protein [Candidatus Hydrogenedentes bacterium]|nr:DUF2238 domain-containing protein [Candidatus Hydrogenedentota bacterium]